MRSLRGRLTVIVAGLALLAVGAVTVFVATTTSDSMEQTLADQRTAREIIVAKLNEVAINAKTWADAEPLALGLADEYEARIVLTDIDGRRLVDTGDGELPPLEGVIDPFGPLAEFGDEAPFDEQAFDKLIFTCLDDEQIPFVMDGVGDIVILGDLDDDFLEDAIDRCYEGVFSELENSAVTVKEPALLFLSFSTTPAIPWTAVGVIGAAVIAGAAIAATLLSGLVTRSLTSLTAAARSIREGDLNVRVETAGPTEVADLAESFNEMTQELARAETRRQQLTADIAHELRSPLTNILGHLDAIDDGVIEPSPDQVQIISSEAERLALLVDDLQTLAALDEDTLHLSPEPTDLSAALDAAVKARRRRALDKGVVLKRTGTTGISVNIDSHRFGQIVGNLLDNAIEHTSPDGVVVVEGNISPDDAVVKVTDTGPGIDATVLPYVFDRLSRGDAARSPGRGGRGLGLAIARGLARAHGGNITAANGEAGGAQFTITIPLG
jgi:two-component system sensor histidine kinase BaeS